jgi:hypothetical protein
VSDNGALIEGLGSPPIRIGTGTPEEDGRLVLVNGKLVAVVVHLLDDHPVLIWRGRFISFMNHATWRDSSQSPSRNS